MLSILDIEYLIFRLLNKPDIIIYVKFASGIKNINFGFYPYIDVC